LVARPAHHRPIPVSVTADANLPVGSRRLMKPAVGRCWCAWLGWWWRLSRRGDGVQADRQGQRWVATDPWRSRSQQAGQAAGQPGNGLRRAATTRAGCQGRDFLGSGDGFPSSGPYDSHTEHRRPLMYPAGPGRCPTVPAGPWETGLGQVASRAGR
jgi:hypothetical protein